MCAGVDQTANGVRVSGTVAEQSVGGMPVGDEMAALHGGDGADGGEPGDVVGVDVLRVFDAIAQVPVAGVVEGVKQFADGPVADGVAG